MVTAGGGGARRFEVVWSSIAHRGSPAFADKLVGQAKKGQVLEGEVVQGEGGDWLLL